MAFLTKKEQSLIRAIRTNNKLTAHEKAKMVHDITYNASIRQQGWRMPVREFLHAMSEHQSNKLSKLVQ